MDIPPVIIPREITFEWSEDFVRTTARRYFSRIIRRPCLISLSLVLIGILGILLDSRIENRSSYWLSIGIGILPLVIWGIHYLRTIRVRDEEIGRRVTVRIAPESISFETSNSVSTMKWSAVKKVMEISRGGFSVLEQEESSSQFLSASGDCTWRRNDTIY